MARESFPIRLLNLPLFVVLVGIAAASMYLPAAHALARDSHAEARYFFYAGTLGLICVTLLALTMRGRKSRFGALGQLVSVMATFSVLPLYLALPFYESLGTTAYLNAFFEMVSAVTTTGATLFDDPTRLSPTLHLWRAQVGWMGGLAMWIAASAILAPLNLGGFEVTARAAPGRADNTQMQIGKGDPRQRLLKVTQSLLPVYVGLTLLLWTLLLMSGDSALVALCHAMSVMATSGISPIGGVHQGASGIPGEAVMVLFMLFALSRLTFSSDTASKGQARLDRDPEFRAGLLLVLAVPLILFLRHWLGAYDVNAEEDFGQALKALWGGLFTVMSFLTTTGFESAHWSTSQSWSGLGTPGLILMGLALIGGGVATTAGGVKLLRVYALYINGLREMDRLVHPSSIAGENIGNRRIQIGGAYIAWIFFMLFALSLALVTVVLAALGVSFEHAVLLSVASLSTTGPLIQTAAEMPIRLVDLGPAAKGVICAAMVLGRLETLAIVALLTPDLWRS